MPIFKRHCWEATRELAKQFGNSRNETLLSKEYLFAKNFDLFFSGICH